MAETAPMGDRGVVGKVVACASASVAKHRRRATRGDLERAECGEENSTKSSQTLSSPSELTVFAQKNS
jgi:hypothetical protein